MSSKKNWVGERCDPMVKMGMGMIHWGGDGAKKKMGMRGMILLWGEGDSWNQGEGFGRVGKLEKKCLWGN